MTIVCTWKKRKKQTSENNIWELNMESNGVGGHCLISQKIARNNGFVMLLWIMGDGLIVHIVW